MESHARGLRTLRVDAGSCGQLLSSILINKLPAEKHLIISRELHDDKWNVEVYCSIIGVLVCGVVLVI